ncbi:MAG: hypothetical protein JO274_09855 [Gammaproteobacteria bacterium]|nr:hypothetical protein [Gammaproteobacteria bacterium]
MPSNINPDDRTQAGAGHFMLTLCRLAAAPASIRPPQAPQLRPFTFFTSCEREPDGSESCYLHMGYFDTLSDAEKWVEAVHGRFPEAIATVAPAALSRAPAAEMYSSEMTSSETPAVQGSDSEAVDSAASEFTPVEDNSLTDTRVMKMLELRHALPGQDGDASQCDQVALLRPEDTNTRLALKEAVVKGAPVSFAVQLQWSAEPIDLSRVPALAVFKAHTLYATESRREGRSRYFLRLGFFADPISATDVATQVRSSFLSAAVVPVVEQEVERVRQAGTDGTSIPYLAQKRGDRAVDSNDRPAAPAKSPPVSASPRPAPRGATLEQTLEELARRETWTDPDALSESGVRHLKVVVQQRSSGRS